MHPDIQAKNTYNNSKEVILLQMGIALRPLDGSSVLDGHDLLYRSLLQSLLPLPQEQLPTLLPLLCIYPALQWFLLRAIAVSQQNQPSSVLMNDKFLPWLFLLFAFLFL